MQRTIHALVLLAAVTFSPNRCDADRGDPVAIIRLSDGAVLIESMWNLGVVIGRADQPESTARGHHRVSIRHGESLLRILDRFPNQKDASWRSALASRGPSSNAIWVRREPGAILVTVDGVNVAHVTTDAPPDFVNGCDVLICDADEALSVAKKSLAKKLLVTSAGENIDATQVRGNTIAVQADAKRRETPHVLVLGSKPIQLSDDVLQLIKRKEAACEASQDVFSKLSVNQLNFKPGNGSHTPRWNAEHMMGRELLFFSQIFHAQDDAIGIIDLNPKQMPPDYKFKHPDWTGMEEAWQMERVSALTRRFAYLLKDLPLDRKAPGSGWTPRALLRQMERHYSDHTANVKKKFTLDDWPES